MIAAAVMSLAAFCSCSEEELTVTDPVISVDTESFQAEAGVQVMQVEVTSNCEWVVLKQDYDGNDASWIQTDRQKGKGNATLGIRVLQNKVAEVRQGQVVIKAEGAKAFIAVVQAAADPLPEPEPDPEPDPDPRELTLFFDFMDVAALDWPTSKTADWSNLKNCDSGLAGDNGGTATDNPHRRAQVTYTLNGAGYDFTFADPDNAVAHNIFLQPSGGLYSGARRHFGLPAIEGRRLVKLVMVQGASNKDPETFNRGIGLTTQIYDAAYPQADMEYIKGGEPQNQCGNLETYTYEFTGTEANTIYYLSSPYNASIIVSLELVYEKAEGTQPKPKPEDLELDFEFNSNLLPDWPVSKTDDWSKLKNCDSGLAGDNGGTATDNPHRRAQVTYTLNGVGYDFTFADPDNAVAHNIYLQKDPKTGIYSGTSRYVGLPAIEHRRLVKLVMVQGASTKDPASFSRGVGITSQIYDANAKAADMQFVAGGELQNQYTNKGEYTYEFTGTAPDTVYWICSPENASIIESMTLVYEYVD